MNVFAARVDKPAVGVLPPGEQVTKADLLTAMSHMGQEQIKVNIDCPKFKGDESDRLEFKNWYDRIDVIVKSHPKWTDEYKLLFLKDKVIGNAATFIAHIDPRPETYDTCIEVLKEQYLDEPYIIDEYCRVCIFDDGYWNDTVVYKIMH